MSAKNITEDIKDVAKELEKLSSEVEAEATSAGKTVKKAASKAKETAKKKADTAKTAAKQTAEKAKSTAKKVAASRKKEVTKTAVVEFQGNQFNVEDIIEKAQKAFKSEHKSKTISDIKVYIKPEDNAAYYVVDDKSAGRVDLS